jgi:hypothetical protein
MWLMKPDGGTVDFLDRRYLSTNLHGIASQTTVVLRFSSTLICTVRFVSLERYELKKKKIAMWDDFATA